MVKEIKCATAGTNTPLTTVACECSVTQHKQIRSQQLSHVDALKISQSEETAVAGLAIAINSFLC